MQSWVTDWNSKETHGLDDKEVDKETGDAEAILDGDTECGFDWEAF